MAKGEEELIVNSIQTWATFFGWCTVINFGLLLVGGFAWILLKEVGAGFVGALFDVTEAEMKTTFLRVLMQYRAAIVLLNLVPYVSLKIMG